MPVPIRHIPFLPLALVLAAACGAPTPASAPTTGAASGTLFIVGGGTQPPAMVARFVELAGGAGRARIAVLPMASDAAAESGAEKAEQLRRLGADAFVLNVTRAQAQGDSAAALLASATGIWFGGGDQARLTAAIRGTPVITAIRERWRAGAVVGGTSAGAAVMSDSMMTGNQRKAGEDTIGYHGDEYPRIVRGSIEIVPGFGFLPGAVVDQHFLRRERHNRLLSVVLERPALLGVGIDESTALLVHGDGRWTVEGESAVLVVDARAARVSDREAPLLGAAEVRLHLLPAGSAFDPRTGRAALPPGR
ncbi:MAG TPA: cyanophycinase [Longimicrobium sp.]|nr:cyanophycinase [Longimicrobium sp.]